MNREFSLTILIPVYNEEFLLQAALLSIDEFCKNNISDYEILLIESGSTDQSGVICDQFVTLNPNHTRVIHEGNRNGFGAAVKLGYQQATKDWIWLVTADLPFTLDTILVASEYFDSYDCILSYRSVDPRKIERQFQSYIYNTLVKITLGLHMRHINSGFKVINHRVIENLELISKQWFLDAELLYWIQKFGYRYIEIPVPIIERTGGVSSVGTLAFWGILKEMFHFLKIKESLNKRKQHL
jgi:glycosyltransferase involved in cell wall biosynthesis